MKHSSINQIYFENIGKKYLKEIVTKPTSVLYEMHDCTGSGTLKRVILNMGLEFTYNENYTSNTKVQGRELNNKKFFEISYCMGGESNIHLLNKSENSVMNKGDLSFHTNQNSTNDECYILNMKNYTGVGICLDNDILRKYFFQTVKNT